jgi:CAAX prenyl protease-like protein
MLRAMKTLFATERLVSPQWKLLMSERAFLHRALPFGCYLAFLFAADRLADSGWSEPQLRWLYAVKISAVAILIFVFRRSYVELRLPASINKLSVVSQPQWLLAVMTGTAVFVAWINLNADWMTIGSSDGFDPRDAGQINWALVGIRLAGAALVVPLMEELFWRSLLMRWIDERNFLALAPASVSLKAFAITAMLFAFEHHLWFAGLVAGLAYNWLYIRSGNLWTPVLAHAVTNSLLGLWVIQSGRWEYW